MANIQSVSDDLIDVHEALSAAILSAYDHSAADAAAVRALVTRYVYFYTARAVSNVADQVFQEGAATLAHRIREYAQDIYEEGRKS